LRVASTAVSMVAKAVRTMTAVRGWAFLISVEQRDAVHPGHLEVGDDALHRIFPETLQGLDRVALRDDRVVAVLRDHPPQQGEHVLFIIDDQDAARHRSSSHLTDRVTRVRGSGFRQFTLRGVMVLAFAVRA